MNQNHRPMAWRRVAASIALLAGAAAAHAGPVVDITIGLDDAHRLSVRYRAPEGVTHLDFLLALPQADRDFRVPRMKPADDCGALVAGGMTLRRGPGCEAGARFIVQPRALALDRMYEPAQPTSDGAGVLFYTGYYAAAATGATIRWHFEPRAGDFGVDDGRRRDAPWSIEPGLVFDGPSASHDQRDDDGWLERQHARQYVFLGHAPMQQTGGALWLRDPALPAVIAQTVGTAGPLARQAYAEASGVEPTGPAALFMLLAPRTGEFSGYHGDRTAGNMIRMSFVEGATAPDPVTLEGWSRFVAHETAHLWNSGIWSSDQARPWLHEGDAEWASMNSMHDAHLDSDAAFLGEIDRSVNNCLLLHGEAPEAAFPAGSGEEPYACGVALQLLGWAELRKRDPAAIDTPLARWGELHRRFPKLDAASFAAFFDGERSTLMRDLLLGEKTPFASTYRRDLAMLVLFQTLSGEPTDADLRGRIAGRLAATLVRADCDRVGLTRNADDVVLDGDLGCKSLPSGAHLTGVAGEALLKAPRAAWAAAHRLCAAGKKLTVDLGAAPPVEMSCPADLPDVPPMIRLPDDALHRLHLMPRPVLAGSSSMPVATAAASAPNR